VDSTASAIALLYRRAGFGAKPAEIAAAAAKGYPAAVDGLLDGLVAADPAGASLPVPAFAPRPTVTGPKGSPGARAAARQQRMVERRETPAAQDWWMNRMIVTSTPLREKLTLQWHGHFATGIAKVKDPQLMLQQNQLFRGTGAGPFGALAQAVAKDPAMMIWLDTVTDDAAHPNENFAREMMELFTLGIGNYSQSDVTAAAHAFAGYSLRRPELTFFYRPRRHGTGAVTYLGHTGDLSGEQVMDIAVHQPASARFVVAWAWSHFAYPVATTDAIVTDLLGAYSPDRPIASLMRGIFLHPEFLSATTRTGLVKQPLEYLAGAARALGLDANLRRLDPVTGRLVPGPADPTSTGKERPLRLVTFGAALGQTMFDPPSVGGWPPNGYWCDTATSLARLQAAYGLAAAADLSPLEGLATGARLDAAAALLGLVDGWGPTTAGALAPLAARPVDLMALALTAPEYVLA
jgi:uncharacterized protein (DUF1800 family)